MSKRQKIIQLSIKGITLLLILLLFISCKKIVTRVQYAGSFKFTTTIKDSQLVGGGIFYVYDTIVSEGTIEWLVDDIIYIKYAEDSYRLKVDENGGLTLSENGSSTSNNHYSSYFSGSFINVNEITFSYGNSYFYMGMGGSLNRVVNGVRL